MNFTKPLKTKISGKLDTQLCHQLDTQLYIQLGEGENIAEKHRTWK